HGRLELGEHAQHPEHGLAGWRDRVETLLVQVEVDRLLCSSPSMATKSCSDRPNRSTDHAATRSTPRRATAFNMASRPGRLSRPLAPLMLSSLNTVATCQP